MNRPIISIGLFQKNPIEFSFRYRHLYNVNNIDLNEVPPTDEKDEFVYFL